MISETTLKTEVHLVVMTKPALPGRVKTRMIGNPPAGLDAHLAAQVHAAMLHCVAERTTQVYFSQYVMAIDGGRLNVPKAQPIDIPQAWDIRDQGRGDLGQRLDYVWRSLGPEPVVFLGTDSPDVPLAAIEAARTALTQADAALGPVDDGGYWALAAVRYLPELIRGIDWGTANVYHQTREAAQRAGLSVVDLPAWHDVDSPADLAALRLRLCNASEPALVRLARDLDQVCPPNPKP